MTLEQAQTDRLTTSYRPGSTGPRTLVLPAFEQMFCTIFTQFLELLKYRRDTKINGN